MLTFLLGLLLLTAGIILWTLQRSYQHVPAHELKRLARSGDDLAVLLYRAVAYGSSLRVLLVGGTVLFTALALVCLVQALGTPLGLLILLLLAATGVFLLVPADQLTRRSVRLAKWSAPAIAWLLERLHPIIDGVVRFVRNHRQVHIHTGLYEKSDLAALLERQRGQADSRIDIAEIDLLLHNLSFGDLLVADAMVPRRVVRMVSAGDNIGPVLMDELARTGHSRFPVYDGKHDNVVGILYLHDLVAGKRTGPVSGAMHHKLTYVHEDFTLYQTLQAFLKTKQHLFLVVNSFEELVGIITIEDVIEQMIGKPIVDEFDHYDDLRAVAASAARQDHAEHHKAKAEPVDHEPKPSGSTPEAKEMVQ